MTWVRENRFLALLLVGVIGGSLALGAMLFIARGKYTEISTQYDEQARQLQELQSKQPYPSQESLDKTQEVKGAYEKRINSLLAEMHRASFPLEEITPNQFADRLREVVSTLAKRAAENGVTLKEPFYLGYDRYKDALPKPEAAPFLARQLKAVELMVSRLIELKVASIDSVVPKPVLQETGTKEATAPVISRTQVDIAFVAEDGQFRAILNELTRARQFLIIRTLSVRNQNEKGPARKVEEAAFASPLQTPDTTPGGIAGGTPPVQRKLDFILGREKLAIAARVEVLDILPAIPSSAKPATPPQQ